MKAIIVSTLLALASAVVAVPPFDPAGVPNVGNGAGKQFITGQCLSDADCASGCCALPTGICSGLGAAFQQGKQGCGFTTNAAALVVASSVAPDPASSVAPVPVSSAVSPDPASSAVAPDPASSVISPDPASSAIVPAPTATFGTTPASGGPSFDPAGEQNVGNGAGTQFIGGQCLSSADCASGCCAGPSGICSGPGASTQAGKTGCGFVAKRSIHLPGRRWAYHDEPVAYE